MTVSLPGVQLHCSTAERWKTGAKTPALLVMHGGLGVDHSYLRPWLDALCARVRVVYYDHRGNGRSLNLSGAPLSHDQLADDAEALRQHLGGVPVFLLGHSYGSFVALTYALRYPQHLRGLILCNATPAMDYPEVFAGLLQQRGTAAQREALAALLGTPQSDAEFARLWRLALPLYFHQQQSAAAYDALAGRVVCRAAAYTEAARDHLPSYNLTARLPELRVPTLVLAGAHDLFMPPAQGAARLLAGIPGAQGEVFADSAHHPFIEEPARFRQVVGEFLQRYSA